MDAILQTMVTRGLELLVPPRPQQMSASLDELHASLASDKWFSDILMHFFSELVMGYTQMASDYKSRSEGFALSTPALLAWRARNLMELNVWISYCLLDRAKARQFYDDAGRDFIAKEWLLDIPYLKRETFAYTCEAYARVLQRGKSPTDRRALAEDFGRTAQISEERADVAEVASIVREAAAARNGWKVILACSPRRRAVVKSGVD